MMEAKDVKIKINGSWYEAIMLQIPAQTMGTENVIRKYILRESVGMETMLVLTEKMYNEIECDDGYKSEFYVGGLDTFIECGWGRKSETKKVLIERKFWDGVADAYFRETYIFDKNHAKVVFSETLPAIKVFFFFLSGRKDTVTKTLWLTANGGFVLEREFSSGRKDYSIIEKGEAEVMVREHSEEKYIEIFHPKEI